jgi:hypothetical protein
MRRTAITARNAVTVTATLRVGTNRRVDDLDAMTYGKQMPETSNLDLPDFTRRVTRMSVGCAHTCRV